MKLTTLLLTGVLLLTMIAPPAEAQRRRFRRGRSALGTAAALGVIGAIAASSNRGNYGRGYGYYGSNYYPGYRSYGYAPYNRGYAYPSYTGAMPFGASYYIDEGDYRNYYDAYNNYLGRTRLW